MFGTISLDGVWKLRRSSGARGGLSEWPSPQPDNTSFDAVVPGCVQQVFMDMTGDPAMGHNCYNTRFIEEEMWCYSRTFKLSEHDSGRHIRLVFDGLDLTAKIFVNGQEAGTHNNFYTPCRLDVSAFVHTGDNTIDVIIESGMFYAATKRIDDVFPGDPGMHITRRVWCRKPQSSFEWDWAPRCVNVGIYKSCRVEISDSVFIDEASVFATLSDDYSTGFITIKQYLHITAECDITVKAEVVETGDNDVCSIHMGAGYCYIPLNLAVKQPKLWYPINYGEQKLYTVVITVMQNQQPVGITTRRTGFRIVVIDQSPHVKEGYNFTVNINGLNVFCKGGNFVPADILFPRITREVYDTLTGRAVECNFNMLRVWGGGMYESDDFYELCDERGILVWQDYIGACANYPGDDNEFFCNYRDEITYQIRRLSPYPSLVILSGNNEIDWEMQANMPIKRYNDANLYYWLVPRILKSEGETRYYQPSSPYSFDNTDANSPIVGDQHPWSIGFYDRDYFKYRDMKDRFPNEGGILGPTSLPNMMACFSEGQAFIHSFDWQTHENALGTNSIFTPDHMLRERFGIEINKLSIPDYVYYGGFCQGEGLSEYILNYRRRMYSSSSAIFWMFNDCWPAVRSWTAVDYLRNRTPSFWAVKRSCAPVTVDIVRENGRFSVYVISERLGEVKARLEYGAFTPDGIYMTETAEITLAPNTSAVAARIGIPPDGYIPYAILSAEGETTARRRFIDRDYKLLGLKKCAIKSEIANGKAIYTSDSMALGVCIGLDGDRPCGDNFFDLYPGKPYEVDLMGRSGDILYSYMG